MYDVTSSTRELHFLSFAFDGAHERLLTLLTSGGTVVLRGDDLWSAERTYQVLCEQKVEIAGFPPAYLQQLAQWVEEQSLPPPPDVRVYAFGGEAMPQAGFDRVRRALKPRTLINGYGPTETVITPLLWKVNADQRCESAYAPIGRAVGSRSTYVLDADLNLSPLGVAGELYVGGDGVARGYWQRAALTAERFIPDPFSDQGGRLYRTGDRVRWNAQGQLEYLGRTDSQVKVRGYRIELGEIEARLLEQSNVAEVLVHVQNVGPSAQLIGYVARKDESENGASFTQRLQQHLQQVLPSYMVPSRLIVLDKLPRMSSGKVDRKRLPAISEDTAQYAPPSTPAERALCKIWQEVLGAAQVGIHDNFYELGGDSIQSLKVLAKLRAHAGVLPDIKLRDLMQYPTIASLVNRVERSAVRSVSPLVPLNNCMPSLPTLFCVHPGMGTVFDYRKLASKLSGRVNVCGIQSRMIIDLSWTDRSISAMAEDYVKAILEAQSKGSYSILGWSLGGTLAIEMTHLLQREGQQVDLLALVDPFVPPTTQGAVSAGSMDAAVSRYLDLHGAKSADETARIVAIAKHLRRLSLRATLKTIDLQPYCWWSSDHAPADIAALEDAIGQRALQSRVLSSDHLAIPSDPAFLQSISELFAPRTEHTYAASPGTFGISRAG